MTSTFQRYEYKYCLNKKQYLQLQGKMKAKMKLDEFFRHTINNIYFDTPNFLLIRRSLEKPVYKEKLRVRWYGVRDNATPIFIELKKKYNGVVYKRRINCSFEATKNFFLERTPLPTTYQGQIANELDYFMNFYENLAPALFLGYEREAYYGVENPDFRMTFDFNIRCQDQNIFEQKNNNGIPILSSNEILLEVKTGVGLPAWLLDFFAQEEIYRCSFSKYGTAYQEILLPKQLGGVIYSA